MFFRERSRLQFSSPTKMLAYFAHMISVNRGRIQRLGAEGSWIILGQMAAVAGSVVSVRVLTGFLSPEQYGELALAGTISDLIGQVLTGGLILGLGRFYSIAAERADLHQFLRAARSCMGQAMLAVLCVAIALSIVMGVVNAWDWIPLSLTCLFAAAVASYNSAISSIQTAARQRREVALHSACAPWLKLALVACFLNLIGISATSAAAGSAVSILAVTSSQLYFLRRSTRQHSRIPQANTASQWQREVWTFALPLSAWGVVTWVQQSSDRWALQTFSTTAELGQYAALFSLGYTPVSVASGLLTTLIAPVAYQRASAGTAYDKTKHVSSLLLSMTAATVCMTLVAAFAAWMYHDWLFHWIVAAEYRAMSYLLPWVVIAGGIFASGQVLALFQLVRLKSRSLLIPKIVTAILGVGVNFAGAYYFGVAGVVAGLIAFSALYFAWMGLLFANEISPRHKAHSP